MSRSATAYHIVSDSPHGNDDREEHVLLEAHVGSFALPCVAVGEEETLYANDDDDDDNDDDDDDDADRTLTVSAEESEILRRRAVTLDEEELARDDEEVTRKVLAAPIPPAVPSPLGDDDRPTAPGMPPTSVATTGIARASASVITMP